MSLPSTAPIDSIQQHGLHHVGKKDRKRSANAMGTIELPAAKRIRIEEAHDQNRGGMEKTLTRLLLELENRRPQLETVQNTVDYNEKGQPTLLDHSEEGVREVSPKKQYCSFTAEVPIHEPQDQDQCDALEAPIRSSSPYSPSFVEFVFSKSPPSVSVYPSYLSPILTPISYAQNKRERAAKRTARRLTKRLSRLTPLELVALAQKRLMKERETTLIKEACMKHEMKRAKRAAISPEVFQTIDIHDDGDEDNAGDQIIITQDSEIGAETKAFAGVITIQDRLSAMSQALSEHAKDGTLRKEPGRHSFYVDAAVSSEYGISGIAVVHKTHRRYWASPWTAKGYRVRETLDQEDAEAWAIWQALQVTLEKVHADRANAKPQDPCSVVVVYSDCAWALQKIGNSRSGGGKVVQKIIAQSMELQRLGVDVHLHWVPGHKKIPGNELADLVAKQARRPVK
ncbi:MAG: hypothetical protein ASARMPREDX12_008135 [Alectoria sarmentosa]|nr:MAG: hypothetical protein ASARMPREDX12_008135 [Alectoria sarmentosa]